MRSSDFLPLLSEPQRGRGLHGHSPGLTSRHHLLVFLRRETTKPCEAFLIVLLSHRIRAWLETVSILKQGSTLAVRLQQPEVKELLLSPFLPSSLWAQRSGSRTRLGKGVREIPARGLSKSVSLSWVSAFACLCLGLYLQAAHAPSPSFNRKAAQGFLVWLFAELGSPHHQQMGDIHFSWGTTHQP